MALVESKEIEVQVDPLELAAFAPSETEQHFREYRNIDDNKWEPCDSPTEVLKVGDVVVICYDTLSENTKIKLPKGLRGCVGKVNDDGDARIFFPEAEFHCLGEHWTECSSTLK